MTLRPALACLMFALLPCRAHAQSPAEARTARAFDAAKKAGAPELYAFLKPFPKGADLHMHLSGAVYAETFIAEAAQQGLCVTGVNPSPAGGAPAVPTSQGALRLSPQVNGKEAPCDSGGVLASDALKNQKLYDALIDSFSMRGFVPSPGITGHDQFFATFDRFGGLKGNAGAWLDEVASRAAAQNEQYLEVMQTPSFSHAAALGYKIGWPARAEKTIAKQQLSSLRDELLAGGLRDDVEVDRKEFESAKASRSQVERCAPDGKATPSGFGDDPACYVEIHWLYQVLRGFPPQQVFAQTLLGFEVASADPDVVGINFVMPEDGRLSMQDYHLQMLMLDYLHSVYPKVHITLHAGELAFGMVPPQGMTFHIREAIDLGHAERIGHGMDVLYETNPDALLKQMAAQHIMVEVNLTSNDVILGQTRTDHPLAAYRAAHVPWALSTDDEGVSRIDLTHEYVKGAIEQNLTYSELKKSARNSLEYSFLHGESLWHAPGEFTRTNGGCPAAAIERNRLSGACAGFLDGSEKAAEQYELERRFAAFEAAQH